MRDEDAISRNLELKQDAFFLACERAGFTMGVLSAKTGISVSTLASYRPTNSRPKPAVMGLGTFVRLVAAVPPALSSLLIEDSGCVISKTDGEAAAWLEIGERACALGAKVMRYQASDNHIDHREAADLREDLLVIVSEGHGMLGGAGR